QAVRLLEKIDPQRVPLGRGGPPANEIVRLRALLSLAFPASTLHQLDPPTEQLPVPALTVTFFGLTGPSGVLPRHYTELLLRLEREGKGLNRRTLRDWLGPFNHPLVPTFYPARGKDPFFHPL